MVVQTLRRSGVGSSRGASIWLHGRVIPNIRPGEHSCAVETGEGDSTRFESRFDQRRTQNLFAGILDHAEGMSFLDLIRKIVGVEEIPDPFLVCASKRIENAIVERLENVRCVRGEVEEVNVVVHRELLELKSVVAWMVVVMVRR